MSTTVAIIIGVVLGIVVDVMLIMYGMLRCELSDGKHNRICLLCHCEKITLRRKGLIIPITTRHKI